MEPRQNSFSIEFVAQNYLNPQKNQFRYRLKGFDPNWVEAGSQNKATYTNISPGDYVFEVVACNNDMVWNMDPAKLNIFIPRPLLLSRLAMVIYLLLIIGIGILVRWIILYRTKLEHQIEIESLKRLEEEKSHQNKLNFFTNISHELRTPLTLIAGPVETLIKSPGLNQGDFNQLSLIKRNTGRLLKLINQLLEFRQIEKNKTELNVIKSDLVTFVHEIYDYFTDVAKQKNINYVFVSMKEHIPLSFDAEKIDKAIFNLLSNAFKFTPDKGTIEVEISRGQKSGPVQISPNRAIMGELKSKEYIQITVKDNGPGIEQSSIEKVFDRFYRVENSEMLKARIKNIFISRVALQEYYARKISRGSENEIPETPDQKMMAKAVRFVEKNLTDEGMDIELLSNHLNLSQSTLYRKLKALTGKSANDFIRTIRLEYAARLLKEGGNNIEEISTLSGFNSHSYFIRSFKEHFGMTPSEFISMN